jgi:hypothetical protein
MMQIHNEESEVASEVEELICDECTYCGEAIGVEG